MKFAFLNAVDLGQSCLKKREIIDILKASNAGFYCFSSSCFFVVDYFIFLARAYIECYNIIVGKKVFLCGKNIFQNIDGLIYFGFYLLF